MRIAIAGYGTWGDVLPALALGIGLRKRGHDVRLLVTRDFVPWLRGRGVDIYPLAVEERAATRSLASPRRLDILRGMRRSVAPSLLAVGREMAGAAGEMDVLLVNEFLLVAASAIAEAHGVRLIHMALQPKVVTSALPIATFPALPSWAALSGLYNRLSYPAAHALRWWTYAREQNRLRREQFGLRPLSLAGFEALCRRTPSVTLISPQLVPPPRDWAAHHRLTGFAFYEDDRWQPPAGLAEFLASGPPPVYIGYGSTHDASPAESTRLLFEALARAGRRAVLNRGWAGLGDSGLPPNVYRVDYAPHLWLFPRMAAIVHHAGAGTSAAALWAGVPSVPLPHSGDQLFWARQLHARGAATRPLPRSKLTAAALAERIAIACRADRLRAGAEYLGRAIRGERGVERSVAAIEELAEGTRASG